MYLKTIVLTFLIYFGLPWLGGYLTQEDNTVLLTDRCMTDTQCELNDYR